MCPVMFSFPPALTEQAFYDSKEASSGEDLNFWAFQESEGNPGLFNFYR